MLDIDTIIDADEWNACPDAAALIERAITCAARHLARDSEAFAIAVILTNDESIAHLNRDWRGQDKPTNVLSFPALPVPGLPAGEPQHLGDIAIAYETLAREAASESKSVADHLSHLAIHGYLHLVGFDHENDRDAAIMEGHERDILARLDIADPYRDDILAQQAMQKVTHG